MRWCQARSPHIRDLKLTLTREKAHVRSFCMCSDLRLMFNCALKMRGRQATICLPRLKVDAQIQLVHLHATVQDDCEDSSMLLLTGACATLFAVNSQLQQLSVSTTWDDDCPNCGFDLPRPLIDTISMASSLEHLLVEIPSNHSIVALADTIPSLKNLRVRSSTSLQRHLICTQVLVRTACLLNRKRARLCLSDSNLAARTEQQHAHLLHCTQVAHMDYLDFRGTDQISDPTAADSLAKALCRCPQLEELKLWQLYLRCALLVACVAHGMAHLQRQLTAALCCLHTACNPPSSRSSHFESVPPGAGLGALCRCLPAELAAATRLTLLVLGDPEHTQLDVTADALPRSLQHLRLTNFQYLGDTHEGQAEQWLLTRDFGSMEHLQSLHLAAHEWAEHWLPLGCVPKGSSPVRAFASDSVHVHCAMCK